jgi:hypothetical protein
MVSSATRTHRHEADRFVRRGYRATQAGGIGSGRVGCIRRVERLRDRATPSATSGLRFANWVTPLHPSADHFGTELRPGTAGHSYHQLGRTTRPACHFRGAFRAPTQSVQTPIGSGTHRSAPSRSRTALFTQLVSGSTKPAISLGRSPINKDITSEAPAQVV